ncbi:MAG: hypothetical protein GXO27_00045 [Chlorobi bacterium]|nr:hypothetical protein [Chlorobiota bacterium]
MAAIHGLVKAPPAVWILQSALFTAMATGLTLAGSKGRGKVMTVFIVWAGLKMIVWGTFFLIFIPRFGGIHDLAVKKALIEFALTYVLSLIAEVYIAAQAGPDSQGAGNPWRDADNSRMRASK